MRTDHRSSSEAETIALAAHIARAVRPGDVIALHGELGAGKTRFVMGLARGLGLDQHAVTSPTFTLCQEYTARDNAITFVHIDAYRLSNADELDTIGWDEYLSRDDVIIVVEWAKRIADAIPSSAWDITLRHVDETKRTITIGVPVDRIDRFERAMQIFNARDNDGRAHACPTCGKAIDPEIETYPFCSRRCRLVDLGKWFSGEHSLSRPATDDDFTSDQPNM